MFRLIFNILLSTILFTSSLAFANEPILNLKDVKVYADDTETFRFVDGKETVIMKSIAARRVSINGAEVTWSEKDTFQSLQNKIKAAYNKSTKKNALLQRLLIEEAHAIPGWFLLFSGGLMGLVGGRATCNAGSYRSTASEKQKPKKKK